MKLDGNTSRNIAAGVLMGGGIASFACFMGLAQYWRSVAPGVPNAALGLVYRHNEHGAISYFSAFQTTACFLLFAAFPLFFFAGFGLAPKVNIRVTARRLAWSAKFDLDDPKRLMRWSQLVGAAAAPVIIFTVGRLLVSALIGQGLVLSFG